jgi:hypothetical protein
MTTSFASSRRPMRALAGAALLAVGMLTATTAHAYGLQPWSTCWMDFDVNGGRLCTVSHPSCDVLGRTTVFCTDGSTSLIPAYPETGINSHVNARLVAVDTQGRPWMVDTAYQIRFASPYVSAWSQWGALPSGVGCVDKIAVTGQVGQYGLAPTTKMLVRDCYGNHRALYWDGGNWIEVASDVLDVSAGTMPGFGGDRLWILTGLSTSTRSVLVLSNGSFVTYKSDASYSESNGILRTPEHIGGRYLSLHGAAACHRGTGIGADWFRVATGQYSIFASPIYATVLGSPSGCDALQVPDGTYVLNSTTPTPVVKIREGGRGPGSDVFWFMTNVGQLWMVTP